MALPFNALGRIRTFNHRLRRPGLVQLSYQCIPVRREGFEPPASPLSTECSASELTARVARPIQLNREVTNGTKRARTLPAPLREGDFTSEISNHVKPGTAIHERGTKYI